MGTYRLILALLVLVSHMGLTVLGLNPGVVAVISFFMLSGYVMTALIKRYYLAPRSIPDFYLDRLMRLQPQYLFYLTLSVIYFFAADVHDHLAKPDPERADRAEQLLHDADDGGWRDHPACLVVGA